MSTDTPLAHLQGKRAALQRQREEAVSTLNAISGAMQLVDDLIAEAVKRGAPPASAAEPHQPFPP